MNYTISSKKSDLQLDRIQLLLSQTYWAADRSKALIERSIANSLCFGAYLENGRQVAFARVITDYVSAYYICDVIVDSKYRGNGIGSALIQTIVEQSCFESMRGFLVTRDAHGLYRKFGFEPDSERCMMRTPRKNTD